MSIYLDNSATTKIRKEALDKYIKTSEEIWGNPSSLHGMGHLAEKELEAARKTILTTLGERGGQVVFTASGSEANNLAILGRAFSKERYRRGAKIITTEGEHASVSSPLAMLSELGFKIVNIPTTGGTPDMDKLRSELTSEVILISMMMVNNETGALYDTAAVSELMHTYCPDALLHIDATQSYLKLPFTKKSTGAHMITISSHKIEGPKGVGALVIDSSVITKKGLSPIIFGGGQEGGLRSGTENVPGCAAFAEAARLGYAELAEGCKRMEGLRNSLIDILTTDADFSEIKITNPPSHAPHILNITLPGIKSETMLHYLSSLSVYVSSGSACSSNTSHISSALTAYGKTAEEADTSIRISLSKRTCEEDIVGLTEALRSGIKKLSRIRK